MKGLFSKIRISRKIVLALGGVLVLCGATGAAAVFIGADKILGPSYAELNGLECTEIQTVVIKKKDRFWVRKYISTDEPGDGMSRVKTALRVAGAVYEKDKPDLVQVVVLDKSGPTDRSAMRGRAVGADVIYIPDPSRVPEGSAGQIFTARYIDKAASADGLFYGEKIALQEPDIQALVARLDDKTDCVKPEVVVPEGHGADPHGAPAGHGETDAHGEADGHGEAPAEGHGAEAEGHGDEAASDGHSEAAAEHGDAGESKGWLASLTGLVFGEDEAPAAENGHGADAGHGETAPAGEHGAAPADGHEGAPAAEHGAASDAEHAAPADGHEAAPAHGDATAPAQAEVHGTADTHKDTPAAEHAAPGDKAAAHEKSGHDAAPAPAAAAHETATAEPAAAQGEGWFSSLKSMVLGGEEAAPAAEDHAAPAAETPAKAEEQSHAPAADHHAVPAEEIKAAAEEHAAPAEEHAAPDEAAAESHGDASAAEGHDGAPVAEGKAKQAGAAWLEKLRAQPLEGASAAPAVPEVPAEDADVLPPKASDKAAGDEHADATH